MNSINLDKQFEIIKKYFPFDENNFVFIESDLKGFSCYKKDDKTIIEFRNKSDLFNGLGLALSNCFNSRRTYNPRFGLMIDCSRNAVINVEFAKEYIVKLSLLGFNYLTLYIEDLLDIKEEPYFGYKKGKYYENEIKEIVEFADLFGIEVFPSIQTLAHLNGIFKWDTYWDINDTDDILLVDKEKTYALIENIIKTCRKFFKSKRINIGMDEAFMVGRGNYTDINGYKSKSEVMRKHLLKVLDIVEKYDFKPEMWSDMVIKNNICDENILSRVKLVYWDYENTSKEKYLENIEEHYKFSQNVGFAGANWTWVGFTPLNHYAMKVSEPAINACKEKNIDDILLTSWGDLNAECSFNACWATMINSSKLLLDSNNGSYLDSMSKLLTGYSFADLLSLDNPNLIKDEVRNNCSYLMLYQDPLLDLFGSLVCDGYEIKYAKMSEQYKKLSKRKSNISYLFKSFYIYSKLLQYKCELGSKIKKSYKENNIKGLKHIINFRIPKIKKYILKFRNSIYFMWMKERKSFGFDNINMKLGSLSFSLDIAKKRIKEFINNNHKIEELEENDIKFFTFFYDGKTNEERNKNNVTYTNHFNIVTNSRMNY